MTLACRLVRKEDLQSTVTYQHPESLRLAWAKQDPVSKGNGDIADRYTDCAPGASEKSCFSRDVLNLYINTDRTKCGGSHHTRNGTGGRGKKRSQDGEGTGEERENKKNGEKPGRGTKKKG